MPAAMAYAIGRPKGKSRNAGGSTLRRYVCHPTRKALRIPCISHRSQKDFSQGWQRDFEVFDGEIGAGGKRAEQIAGGDLAAHRQPPEAVDTAGGGPPRGAGKNAPPGPPHPVAPH